MVEYTSSEDGLLKQIRFNDLATNAITYNYTNEQLTSLAYGGQTYDYTYTPSGQTSTIKVGSNTLASHTYDKNGLVTNTSFGTGGTAKILNTYKVGPTGKATTQLQTETLQTNDANAAKTIVNQYSYDANNQITSIVSKKGTVASTISYTYDNFNQLTQEKLSNNHYINYKYDEVGNRTSKSIVKNGVTTTTNYTFNEANQMTKAGSIFYEYEKDANGKIVGNIKDDGRYQYTWNALDQLTTVKDSAGKTFATYEYDENDRRIYSKVDNTETYYRYDGTSNQVLFETNKNGTVTKAYTYDAAGHPLTMTYNGETYYYLTNYRGDVLTLTNASGNAVAEYTYDAWGNILSQSGDMASVNPYRYAGYRYDEETKLYYLMARYYNPDTGVFLSLDPEDGDITNPITMNGNNYANNNPMMIVDPDGHNGLIIGAVKVVGKGISKVATKTKKPKKVTTPTKIGPGKINFNRDGVKHVENRHIGNKQGWEHKSKWTVTSGYWRTYSRDAVKNPDRVSRDGDRFVYEKEFKKVMGVDAKGKKLYKIRVVVDKNGNLVTAFPQAGWK